jgi:hypothetical protein
MKFKVIIVGTNDTDTTKLQKLLNDGWRISQTDYKDAVFETPNGAIFVLVNDQPSN